MNDFQNIYDMLCHTVAEWSEEPAYYEKSQGEWQKITWQQLKQQADEFAIALLNEGLQSGDTVSILAGNTIVWPVADLGSIAAGGISIGLYPSSSPEQCAYILNHSQSKFAVVDTPQQFAKIWKIRNEVPSLQKIIVRDPVEETENVISWQDFLSQGQKNREAIWERYQQIATQRNLDDTAIIVYTSGTTGHPKGACLSSRYVIASSLALYKILKTNEPKNTTGSKLYTLSFLPFCHVAERISGMYARVYSGYAAYFVDDLSKLYSYMLELGPHFFGGLPRFYEKIYAKIMNDVETGKINKEDFYRAIDVNKKIKQLRIQGQPISEDLQQQAVWAEENICRQVRGNFGPNILSCSSGAAPIPKEVLELFEYAGNLNILEAYGLTEFVCCAFSTVDAHRPNSVGKPMHGCEVKIAGDGEILLKGPQMFSGYYQDEKATAETIDSEGWLHTGDIGKLDEDGFLYITGRKKEFIKTSTGKKIAPLYIENLCKRNHLISNIMVYGDNKKYLTALITLNQAELESYAKVHQIHYNNYAELTQNNEIKAAIDKAIQETNAQVSSTEQVKKYTILPRDFSIEDNEITPTGKVKRKNVSEIYHDVIEKMYT